MIVTLILNYHIGFGQVNPENIILEYDIQNGTEKVIFKNELSADFDSLSSQLIDEKRKELMSTKDSATIKNLIVGTWEIKNSVRVNGESANIQLEDKFIFSDNGEFLSYNRYDTVGGKWFIAISDLGNLKLEFDEPQTYIKDKAILKYLPKEQIEAMTYTSNILAIAEIDEQRLIFATFILTLYENIDDMHYRLILTTYLKDE